VLKAAKIPAAELLAGVAKAAHWAIGQAFHRTAARMDRSTDGRDEAAQLPGRYRADAGCWRGGLGRLFRGTRLYRLGCRTGQGRGERGVPLPARPLAAVVVGLCQARGLFDGFSRTGRRERNTALAGRILDLLNGNNSSPGKRWRPGSNFGDDPEIASRAVSPELLAKILEEELSLKKFPGYGFNEAPKYSEDLNASLCDCPKCRQGARDRRGGYEFVDDGDEDDFEDEDDDFADPGGFALSELLKGLGKMMGLSAAKIKETGKARANGETQRPPWTESWARDHSSRERRKRRRVERPKSPQRFRRRTGSLF